MNKNRCNTLLLILIIVILGFNFSSCKRRNKYNSIERITLSMNEYKLKNWYLIGPFHSVDSIPNFDFDHLKRIGFSEDSYFPSNIFEIKENSISPNNNDIKLVEYEQNRDYIDLSSIFQMKNNETCYAYTNVYSHVEQEIALLCGSSNGIKVWVNNELIINKNEKRVLKKNDDIVHIKLQKGKNTILVKLNFISNTCHFHLNFSALEYVNKYNLLKGYEKFLDKYLIERFDSISILTDKVFFRSSDNFKLTIHTFNDSLLLDVPLDKKKECIKIAGIDSGCYKISLIFDVDTLTEFIAVGHRENYLNYSFDEINSLNISTTEKLNLETIKWRSRGLIRYGIKNGFNTDIERKLAQQYYEFFQILNYIKNGTEAFKNISGLHLRGYKSSIDSITEHYMIYVPKNYKKEISLPMITELPFILGRKFRFLESYHVANIDRIEYICKLADKYGFIYLWPNSRIYDRYNLNPIVEESTFETIKDVQKYYNVDESRLFIYGSCSGGLEALLLTVRYPSFFSAIAVEGPETRYTLCESFTNQCDYPTQWVANNNILKHINNLNNLSLFIIGSKNDIKSSFDVNKSIVNYLNKNHGNALIDEVNNPTKNQLISLMTENYNIYKVFEFFSDKQKKTIKTFDYSTFQHKYSNFNWLVLEKIKIPLKAQISGEINNNQIKMQTQNIEEFSIKLDKLPQINLEDKVQIYVNSKLVYNSYAKNEILIQLAFPDLNTDTIEKNAAVEGPVNHIFSSPFIVVKDSQIPDSLNSISSIFINNWKSNYFENCLNKYEFELTDADIKNNNLIICHQISSNVFYNKIFENVPIKLSKSGIQIEDRFINGTDLSYISIYPNPLNKNKYVLILGSNSQYINKSIFENLSYKGWFDYEIYKFGINEPIDYGYYNRFWKVIES